MQPLGLVCWQASWPLSTLSGQDVSLGEEESHQSHHLLQEGSPFQGPKLDSCLTLGNELSKETHVLTKQEILLGKGTQVESSRVKKPRRTALQHGSQCLGFMVVLGSGRTRGVSFRPFPNSSGCWRLISSIFFIGISCHKTTHANGYYGAGQGRRFQSVCFP